MILVLSQFGYLIIWFEFIYYSCLRCFCDFYPMFCICQIRFKVVLQCLHCPVLKAKWYDRQSWALMVNQSISYWPFHLHQLIQLLIPMNVIAAVITYLFDLKMCWRYISLLSPKYSTRRSLMYVSFSNIWYVW